MSRRENESQKTEAKDWQTEREKNKKLLCEKKEDITENVGKKETYTESIKRNIFTILIIFISTRYKRSTESIIIKTKKKTIVKTVKLFIIMIQ